jgi:hypothetical protein
VDGANIGVIQRGGGTRFALEALEKLRVLRHFIGKKFEGDLATQARVVGFIDDTHAAATQFAGDCVVRNALSDQRRTTCHGLEDISLRVGSGQARGRISISGVGEPR